MAVYESILNILPYFEVLSHRSWSSVYFKKMLGWETGASGRSGCFVFLA